MNRWLLLFLVCSGCVATPRRAGVMPPAPKGETHQPKPPAVPTPKVAVLRAGPGAVTRPPPRADWTNPVPKVGTSLEFMPLTNSEPIRYIGQTSTNLIDWQTFTNAILDGSPHLFHFHAPDDGSARRYFRVVWRPR